MADVQRHKYGATDPAVYAVDAAKVFSEGDLGYMEVDDARAADQMTYGHTGSASALKDTQLEFAAKFAGVALSKKDSTTVAGTVRLARSGVFEFACASATFELDSLVGPAANGGGTALENQKVVAVTDERRAIGRVAKRVSSAATKVLVSIDVKLAKNAILNRCIQGGEELECKTANQRVDIIPAGIVRVGSHVVSGHALITEVMAGSSQDQGIATIYDTDDNAIMTLTPSDAAADAVGDIVLGSVNRPATGTALIPIAALKGIYAKVTQVTAGGTPTGKYRVYIELAVAG
jgi:hypothetical protein